MVWAQIYARGIDVETLRREDEEYSEMLQAAIDGNCSAQYCLALWYEKIDNKPEAAIKWYKKAASQNFKEALEAVSRLEGHGETASESVTADSPSTFLVIREHDFQEAKNSLRKYTEQAKEEVELSRVPSDGGLFNLGDHKVTGSELNRITTQIQDYLINLNHLSKGLVDEFGQVYKAFEYLDKDYISGIVASIKAAEKVSIEEQKDRKDIKELIEQHRQSIAVLKKFKADIEKLKHLTDIDKAWELIEKQAKLSKELSDYIAGLSKLKHIKDVDSIHTDLEKSKKEFAKVSEQQAEYMAALKSVREYCDALSNLKHIKDIDILWDNSEIVASDIDGIRRSVEVQCQAISAFDKVLRGSQEEQAKFFEKINKLASDLREDFGKRIRIISEEQTAKLCDIEKSYAKVVEQLINEQREQLSAIEGAQKERHEALANEQALTLSRIEKTQKEAFEQLSENQSAILEQVSNEQSANWERAIKLLEEEKAALNEQVATIKQKVKSSYIVAGGAVALTIVQLLLNVLGVL